MAKKRFSRTVTEAGHTNEWNDFVQLSYRRDRRRTASYCRKALFDAEYCDAAPLRRRDPRNWSVDYKHDYNFRPLRRWLDAQVGRRWDEVCCDLRRMINTDTHMGAWMFERVRRWVCLGCVRQHQWCDLITVDGVLVRQR